MASCKFLQDSVSLLPLNFSDIIWKHCSVVRLLKTRFLSPLVFVNSVEVVPECSYWKQKEYSREYKKNLSGKENFSLRSVFFLCGNSWVILCYSQDSWQLCWMHRNWWSLRTDIKVSVVLCFGLLKFSQIFKCVIILKRPYFLPLKIIYPLIYLSLVCFGFQLWPAESLLQHVGESVVGAHRLRCSSACGILVPQPGMPPVSPELEGRSLPTREVP